jgi:hypothetical protein
MRLFTSRKKGNFADEVVTSRTKSVTTNFHLAVIKDIRFASIRLEENWVSL